MKRYRRTHSFLGRSLTFPSRAWCSFKCLPVFAAITTLLTNQVGAETEKFIDLSNQFANHLLGQKAQFDQLIWKNEFQAQRFEKTFTALWDSLRGKENQLEILSGFRFTQLRLAKFSKTELLDLGIRRNQFSGEGREINHSQWLSLIKEAIQGGYRLIQSEWHHSEFYPSNGAEAAHSLVKFVLHIAREEPVHRVIIRGDLEVEWKESPDVEIPIPHSISVSRMEILDRQEPVIFEEIFQVKSNEVKERIMPLAVYDLNRDGLSEIIVGGQNLVIRNQGNGKFVAEQFLADEVSIFDSAILADFTGDGMVDFVAVDDKGRLLLFQGDENGVFASQGRVISDAPFTLPKVFTAGDIDHDGDLDLYIANYKFPYRQGQWPTPYYDANDGYPAYMLRNDGEANFSDITEESGLAEKRFRRAFSGSFFDLDGDLDMDLIVVSDFAGIDLYLNEGNGHFRDITNRLGDDRYFFGMGHTFGDYDLDGKLDLYVIGMSSTTANRLEKLKLVRPDKPRHNTMRRAMGYGNRMFLLGKDLARPEFDHSVARTGWSWGSSSFDFDNDGDRDIFVANGHYSGRSSQDYCTTFWTHDIYTEGSDNSLARDILFQAISSDLRSADISWNGFEHKVLFMNLEGKDFVNIAFLLGAAFEYDGRAVVAADLDADGRVDLLVVEYKTAGYNKDSYILHVYRNVYQQAGHWIGVRLHDSSDGFFTTGAKIRLKTENGDQIAQIVTGDSFSSQHPATVHFGLGNLTKVEAIEVQWQNGKTRRVERPEIDQYHWVVPKDKSSTDSRVGQPERRPGDQTVLFQSHQDRAAYQSN